MSSSNKVDGQFKGVAGTLTNTAGAVIGSKSLQKDGQEQHAKGEAEVQTAKIKGALEGAMEVTAGWMEGVKGAVTGDTIQQASGNARKAKGEAQQEMNKA